MTNTTVSNLCTETLIPLGETTFLLPDPDEAAKVEEIKKAIDTIQNSFRNGLLRTNVYGKKVSALLYWQPIGSAPKDRVIITDKGFAKFVTYESYGEEGWFICREDGTILSCGDYGIAISKIEPQVWMDIPEMDI